MNRKFPRSRPFFTIRGLILFGCVLGFALVAGFLVATVMQGAGT